MQNKQLMKIILGVAGLLFVLLAVWFMVSFEKAANSSTQIAKPTPLATVNVVNVQASDLPILLTTQGHLVPLNLVDIRPQANGIVQHVHFKEGDEIKAGQLLFTLDSSDADSQLARATALAEQIKAQVEDAERDVARTRKLASSKFLTSSAVDTTLSKLESLNAQHRAAVADIQNARTVLGRTHISAPINGLAGALSVHPGTFAQVGASNTALVTIVQFDPIGVEFTLAEQNLSDVLAAKTKGVVQVFLESDDGARISGQLVFINNTVATDTATITMKAGFPNAAKTLWPGAFVRLVISAGTRPGSIALPPQAVLEGPDGRFVQVVGADNKIATVPVSLLRMQNQLAVVAGLKGGERVVSEGGNNLKPGMVVHVTDTVSVPK
jgi:RND family efflux transporter MFP subunit